MYTKYLSLLYRDNLKGNADQETELLKSSEKDKVTTMYQFVSRLATCAHYKYRILLLQLYH